MAASETAKLLASLELKDKFSPTLKNANAALGKFDSKLSATEGRAFRAGQQIGTGMRNVGKLAAVGIGILTAQVALGLQELVDLEKQTAQTEAVLKSTGGAAGLTAKDIRSLAEQYEGLNAIIDDKVIQDAENLLLTFTNVRKDAFEPALLAALDMNTALGGGPEGMQQTIIQLGKALNDPARGLTALRKVGVAFTKDQRDQIKALAESGDLLGAQKLILAELNREFGGSFLAEGGTVAGKVAKFEDSIQDLNKTLATALLPAVGNIADALTDLFADPEMQRGAESIGKEIGKLFSKENIKTGAKALGDVFKLLRDAAPAIGSALGTVGTVLRAGVDAFMALPPEVRALLVGGVAVNKLTGGLVSNIAGGIFGALKSMVITAGVVQVNGPVAGVPGGAAPGGKGGIGSGVLALGFAGAILAAAVPIGEAFAAALPESLKGPGGKGESESQRRIREGLAAMEEKQGTTIEKINVLGVTFGRGQSKTTSVTEKVRTAAQETKRETSRGLAAAKAQTRTSGQTQTNATRTGSNAIVAAVRASRPIITVNVSATATTRTVTKTVRYGPTGGSRTDGGNVGGKIVGDRRN